MKKLIGLINKSFVGSDELNDINEMNMHFVSSLNDKQCIEFLKFCVEIEELQKVEVKEYINHTYKICKDVFKLRQPTSIIK